MNYNTAHIKENGITAGSHEQKLLDAFPNTSFNKEDAAEALGISVNGAYKLLQRMKEKGLINAQKSGKKWLYNII